MAELERVLYAQMLILFAPHAVLAVAHLPLLLATLGSRQPALRKAAADTLRHLAGTCKKLDTYSFFEWPNTPTRFPYTYTPRGKGRGVTGKGSDTVIGNLQLLSGVPNCINMLPSSSVHIVFYICICINQAI